KSAQTPQRAREAAPVQPRLAAPGGNPPTRLTRRESTPAPREVHSWEASVSQASPAVVPARTSAPSTGSQPAVGAGSATVAQQLLAWLSQVDVSRKALTREQAAELNRLLRQLLEQGDVAIPGIREFLKSNQDINFDALDGGEFVDLEGAVTRFPHAAGHVERQAGQLRIHARELQRGSAPPPLRRLHRRHGGDVPPLVPSAACHHVRGQRREAHHQAR